MNILLLLVDQMRFDALSCNGAPVCRTPNIDALAAEGMSFTRAYTTNALCSPARASILTGLFPHKHGQLANTGNFNRVFDTWRGHETYFSRLRKNGYQSGYVGKFHLEREGDCDFWQIERWKTGRNFREGLKEHGIDFDAGVNEVQPLEWGGSAKFYGPSVLSAEQHHDGWVGANAVDFIKSFDKDRPFVLCAGFLGPHFPYAVPKPYDTLYNPSDVPRWINFDETFDHKPIVQQKELMRWNTSHLTWSDWQKVIAAYWGYCTYIDEQIGRIIKALKETGQYENTAIVFTSDHGDMLGSHRLFNKGFNMYEEDYHIPFVAKIPGTTPARKECGAFISLTDIYPSFLSLAGLSDGGTDGRSFLPLLGPDAEAHSRDCILAEFNGYESTLLTSRMLRTDKWKYIYNPFAEDELYDMDSDPGELRNLAHLIGFTHVLRRMRARMFEALRDAGDGIVALSSWQSNSYGLHISPREQ